MNVLKFICQGLIIGNMHNLHLKVTLGKIKILRKLRAHLKDMNGIFNSYTKTLSRAKAHIENQSFFLGEKALSVYPRFELSAMTFTNIS